MLEYISVCLPLGTELNSDRFAKGVGIHKRHVAPPGTKASDLCIAAAEAIFKDANGLRQKIDALIFVTQTPDHVTPSTSSKIQHRLGLRNDIFAIDVNLGCSGWTHGIAMANALRQFNRVLVLVGDTGTHLCKPGDTATNPIFSDAGSATIINNYPACSASWTVDFGVDGAGYAAIQCETPVAESIQNQKPISHMRMDGQSVYEFATRVVPDSIARVANEDRSVHKVVLHQANKAINALIAKKAGFVDSQMLSSLHEFGNTMGASLPVTLCYARPWFAGADFIFSGYGVGLSWSSIRYTCPMGANLLPIRFI